MTSGVPLQLAGQTFGRLTVLRRNPDRRKHWIVRCECGNERSYEGGKITFGEYRSCGCARMDSHRARLTTHGMSQTKLYYVWTAMKCRCLNPKDKGYQWYGARGITVAPEWLRFEAFHAWAMASGYEEGKQLDRIDVDKGYGPDNCQWATYHEQARNKRRNVWVTLNGERMVLKDAMRRLVELSKEAP